ncbi:MAG TPA: asparaginase [Micromonosporaceae bacterium]
MTGGYAGGVPVAEVVRSGFVEGRHHGSVVVLDAQGRTVASVGDPDGPIFPRSSNKLMQATAMLRAGLALTDPADLAVVAASHSAEPFHLDRIGALLHRAGLSEEDLGCPPDLPLSATARAAVYADRGGPRRLYMNCSGKHTGMLLTCRAAGWPIAGYLAQDHPLQRACRAEIERMCQESVAALGVDGCGAPVAAVSLTGLARAFLAGVEAAPGTPERTIADAMRAFPELVSGTDREDLRLMRAVPGLLSKVGAEGVTALAVAGRGAVAVKIDDGADRARLPVVVAALRWLDLTSPELDEVAHTPILGGGEPVGEVRVIGDRLG